MFTVVNETSRVNIPKWVVDLESFRRWSDTDDFPETGYAWYIKGDVWVDLSKEQLFSHLAVKNEFNVVLHGLVKTSRPGLYFPAGVFLSNVHADIAGNPDAIFVSNAVLESGGVLLIEAKRGGDCDELEGSPDMVLEVISRGSIHKDRVTMRRAYWEAGIREYWLVDAREEPLTFDILRHTARGYVATRKQDGWLKSVVFGKSFRLTQQVSALGHPEYSLELR
jgi:Uma2 family endonuclease